jgi:hypothetical protein
MGCIDSTSAFGFVSPAQREDFMNLKMAALGSLVLALPLVIEVPVGDRTDTGTHVQVAGGVGYYGLIRHGCEGDVISHLPVSYGDVGGTVEHRFQRWRIGVRGGLVHDEFGTPRGPDSLFVNPDLMSRTRENRYINPYVSLEERSFSVGGGWVAADRKFIVGGDQDPLDIPFSAHVRFGDPAHRTFTMSWMENVPLYSGGGYLDLSLGFGPAATGTPRSGTALFPTPAWASRSRPTGA